MRFSSAIPPGPHWQIDSAKQTYVLNTLHEKMRLGIFYFHIVHALATAKPGWMLPSTPVAATNVSVGDPAAIKLDAFCGRRVYQHGICQQ